MPKVKVYSIDKKEKNRIEEELFDIIANLKSKKEVFNFLIGLFSSSETLMIGRRIQIAKKIIEEKDYDTIRRELKVSFQTINKIERWLKEDEEKSRLIFEKLKKYIKKENRIEYKKPTGSMLDKYAHHRILKNLLS